MHIARCQRTDPKCRFALASVGSDGPDQLRLFGLHLEVMKSVPSQASVQQGRAASSHYSASCTHAPHFT